MPSIGLRSANHYTTIARTCGRVDRYNYDKVGIWRRTLRFFLVLRDERNLIVHALKFRVMKLNTNRKMFALLLHF